MLKYLELCVDLRKSHLAKEGLYQYKNICQQVWTYLGFMFLISAFSNFQWSLPFKVNTLYYELCF